MGHSSPALAVVSQARGRRACHMFSNRLSPGQAIFRPCTVIPSEIDILMNVRGRSLHVRPPFCALRWVASWHDEQGGGQRAAGSGQRVRRTVQRFRVLCKQCLFCLFRLSYELTTLSIVQASRRRFQCGVVSQLFHKPPGLASCHCARLRSVLDEFKSRVE